MEFSISQSELPKQSVDALVYGARTELEMTEPVGAALRQEAESSIVESASSESPIGLGQVVVTDAAQLDAEYVLHAAAIPDYGRGEPSTASIRAATRNALRRADALDCSSLATAVLGAGTSTHDFREGAQIVCETIADYQPSSLTDCRVVVSSERKYDHVARIADNTSGWQ